MLVQSPVVCSVSVVGEVGERMPMAPRTGSSGKGGGLITSPVVFSSVELSGISRTKLKKFLLIYQISRKLNEISRKLSQNNYLHLAGSLNQLFFDIHPVLLRLRYRRDFLRTLT